MLLAQRSGFSIARSMDEDLIKSDDIFAWLCVSACGAGESRDP